MFEKLAAGHHKEIPLLFLQLAVSFCHRDVA